MSSQCLIHLTVGRWKFTFRAIAMCTMCEVYPFTTARDSSIRHERILCQFRTLEKRRGKKSNDARPKNMRPEKI